EVPTGSGTHAGGRANPYRKANRRSLAERGIGRLCNLLDAAVLDSPSVGSSGRTPHGLSPAPLAVESGLLGWSCRRLWGRIGAGWLETLGDSTTSSRLRLNGARNRYPGQQPAF